MQDDKLGGLWGKSDKDDRITRLEYQVKVLNHDVDAVYKQHEHVMKVEGKLKRMEEDLEDFEKVYRDFYRVSDKLNRLYADFQKFKEMMHGEKRDSGKTEWNEDWESNPSNHSYSKMTSKNLKDTKAMLKKYQKSC